MDDPDFKLLLDAALNINDLFDIRDDHVEFRGSMNDVEYFRELVNRIWHKTLPWPSQPMPVA